MKIRSRALAALALVVALASSAAPATAADTSDVGSAQSFRVDVPEEPGSTSRIGLDVDLYLPAAPDPAPAVLLAHGFGASKRDLAGEARRLVRQGYVVMAYSARGFGDSGGRISLDSLDHEVADAARLVDVLGGRQEVLQRDGDPVVGVVGASYGGALALMLGATDRRIDTVVASITWNDLADALVPDAVIRSSTDTDETERRGVFKQAWTAQLFGGVASPRAGGCGRFTVELCTLYTRLLDGEPLTDADRALLDRSSPSAVLDDMTAPTLLLQGTNDTLFGLDQADANARQIAAAGAPVEVTWFGGGHDGGGTGGTTRDVDTWLADHLGDPSGADATDLPFRFLVPASPTTFAETRTAASYPVTGSSTGARAVELPMDGRRSRVVNPPGGLPATITSLPGVGSVDQIVAGVPAGLPITPGQWAQGARFGTPAIQDQVVVTGAPTVTIRVAAAEQEGAAASVPPPTEAVLFAQLRVRSGDSSVALGGSGVAPIRVALPADGSAASVQVRLPVTSWRLEKGDLLRLVLRTTDAQYQPSPGAASFVVDVAGPITLPTLESDEPVEAAGAAPPSTVVAIVAVLIIALLLGGAALLIERRRARGRTRATQAEPSPADPTAAPPPLVIRGLTKDYRSGFRAVGDLSFTVQTGQVLGLLGPNGAGKTTALRMVTGLLRPDAGEVEIFGESVTPGARVLSRVGCFIEGPGFLPHLSGRRNLELYWAASGRPRVEARLEEALAIADLGAAVNRRVGGYSQGMRQRLAIAQAMLGMPALLILDEPTNGLDPPQIYALRGVLRRYAATGRTVIVSSHLLGEVEQTCSHVVVMANGRLIASGTVAELAGDSTELTIEVTDVPAAIAALDRLGGVDAVSLSPGTIRVVPSSHPAEAVVAAIAGAGVGVRSVVRGRHLEETFLSMVGAERTSG